MLSSAAKQINGQCGSMNYLQNTLYSTKLLQKSELFNKWCNHIQICSYGYNNYGRNGVHKNGSNLLTQECNQNKSILSNKTCVPYIQQYSRINNWSIHQCTKHKSMHQYGHNLRHLHTTIVKDNNEIPIKTVQQFGLPNFIEDALKNEGFVTPNNVQAEVWQSVMNGRNLVSIGMVGPGKTLSYMVPGIAHIATHQRTTDNNNNNNNNNNNTSPTTDNNNNTSPIMFVISPTTDHATETDAVAQTLGSSANIRSTCLFDGSSLRDQIAKLHPGIQVCVTTPTRLLTLLGSGDITLDCCSLMVFDELDRLLHLGHEPIIRQIMSLTKADVQTLMFASESSAELEGFIKEFSCDPLHMTINSSLIDISTQVNHDVQVVQPYLKYNTLMELLTTISETPSYKVLVLTRTRADRDTLRHGLAREFTFNPEQPLLKQRKEKIYNRFRNGKSNIFLAAACPSQYLESGVEMFSFRKSTDTVTGITVIMGGYKFEQCFSDISDITHIINYDCPISYQDYLSHVGCVSISGNRCTMYTFLSEYESKSIIDDVIKVLEQSRQEVPTELYKLHDSDQPVKLGNFEPYRYNVM